MPQVNKYLNTLKTQSNNCFKWRKVYSFYNTLITNKSVNTKTNLSKKKNMLGYLILKVFSKGIKNVGKILT